MPNFQNPLDALQQFINARQLPMVNSGLQFTPRLSAETPVVNSGLQLGNTRLQYTPRQSAGLPFFTTFQDRLRARQRQQQNTPRFQPLRGNGFYGDIPFNNGGLTPPTNRPRPQTY